MKNKVSDVAVALLAGGRASRLSGFNKAFIRINGIPIIQRTIALLEKNFEEIILVTNYPRDFKLYETKTIITKDLIKGIGPLGGMHSALSVTSRQAVFFMACDMPFLHNALIRQELKCFKAINSDCLVPRISTFIEPLHAVYKTNLKNNICSFVKNNRNYAIKDFLETISVCYWDLENNSFNRNAFKNLNTKEDLKGVKAELCE